VTVPNGVDVSDALPQRDWLPDGHLRLMYLGRLSPKKGIENLLHAMDHLDDPQVSLTIYGGGDVAYASSLQELAGQLGLLGKSVFFAGMSMARPRAQLFMRRMYALCPLTPRIFACSGGSAGHGCR